MKEYTARERLLMRCVPEGNKYISKMISLFVTECSDLSTTLRKKDPFESNGKTVEHHFGLNGVYVTKVLFCH